MTLNALPNKADLRAQVKASRVQQVKDETLVAGLRAGFARQLARLVQDTDAKTVAAYLPFGTEPDIGEFLSFAKDRGIQLVLPVSQADGTLRWVRWNGETEPGLFGFEEPLGETCELSEADLILMPALAVDSQGNRLGKGKGFYDRALEVISPNIRRMAVVYDYEILDHIPADAHDQKVHGAVTQTRSIWFEG